MKSNCGIESGGKKSNSKVKRIRNLEISSLHHDSLGK
jgi:hypothetical protein